MKASVRKHPLAWVLGGVVVGGLFLANVIQGSPLGKIRRAV